jgi:hypothetical protein
MSARRYAESTTVPIAKTRGEIDRLLHDWGCHQIVWGNDFQGGRFMLQFVWRHEGQDYLARFTVQLPTDAELAKMAQRKGSWRDSRPLAGKLEKLREARGRVEHRQLLLWLKAALNAVESGIIKAEQVFLPWLVTRDGRTVAERALEELPALIARGGSNLLLGSGDA